jgi:hypothetical protein
MDLLVAADRSVSVLAFLAPLLATTLAVTAPAAASREQAFALLADNRLVEVAVPSGHVIATVRLAPKPTGDVSEGRFLATDARDRRLFVLVQTGAGKDWIAVLDSRTAKLRARYELERGVLYRGITLAGDVLYAYGGRLGREVDTTNHAREESAVLTELDEATGMSRGTITVRPADGHSWWIYWGAARGDGSRIALSYHGGCFPESIALCTTGADWISVEGASLRPCQGQKARLGCMSEAHGMIEPYGVGWIATSGGETLVQYGRTGNVLRRLHTGITRDHLMDFAFNVDGSRLYAIASCSGSKGGLRRVSLVGGPSTSIRPRVCGDAVAVGVTAFVIRKGSTLELRDLRTAKLLHRRRLASDILDAIATR